MPRSSTEREVPKGHGRGAGVRNPLPVASELGAAGEATWPDPRRVAEGSGQTRTGTRSKQWQARRRLEGLHADMQTDLWWCLTRAGSLRQGLGVRVGPRPLRGVVGTYAGVITTGVVGGDLSDAVLKFHPHQAKFLWPGGGRRAGPLERWAVQS